MKTVFISLYLFVSAVVCLSAEPTVWSVNSRADVLRGDARGVSIDADGSISLAPKLTEVFKTEQQYIWSSAVDRNGNVYLGTGGDGKIFRVAANGGGAQFADLAEMNVSALAIGNSGEIYAGTSPDGKVYRLDNSGTATVYFDPKQKYIWSLAALPDGSLAVGTGDGGRVYKVRTAGATPESSLLFDTSETNIITLAVDKQGNLYAGTDPGGMVMRFGPDGKPFGLLDSSLREVHSLAVATDGSIYALVLGEAATAAKPASSTEASSSASASESKTVSVTKPVPGSEAPGKSRYDLKDVKSAVYRILPDGANDLLWTSATVMGFSLYAHQTGVGVLVGTSDKGRIYNISNDARETLILQTDANQVSTIGSLGSSLFATSSNQGSLYRIGPDSVAEGTYDSVVLDAKATATWGRIWWRSSGGVSLQTRSGNTEKPNETWSAWSPALTDQKGAQITSPKARYLQWRAGLRSAGTVSEVNVAFAPRNIAPEVLTLNVLPTNVGLAANPPVQIDPNIELSGMDPVTFGIPNTIAPPRRVFQRGATSLQWTAEDRNGDRLVYDVLFKEVSETDFKPLRTGMTENFMSIDGQALADGRYIFKVVAHDTPSNTPRLALTGERTTEPIDIDNTPPVITAAGPSQVSGTSGRMIFDAADAGSYITHAEYSVNGGEWQPVYPDDGISDSPRERYTVEILMPSAGEYAVTIRVYDVNGNSGNARAVVRR